MTYVSSYQFQKYAIVAHICVSRSFTRLKAPPLSFLKGSQGRDPSPGIKNTSTTAMVTWSSKPYLDLLCSRLTCFQSARSSRRRETADTITHRDLPHHLRSHPTPTPHGVVAAIQTDHGFPHPRLQLLPCRLPTASVFAYVVQWSRWRPQYPRQTAESLAGPTGGWRSAMRLAQQSCSGRQLP